MTSWRSRAGRHAGPKATPDRARYARCRGQRAGPKATPDRARYARCRGQIAFPAMILLPTLMLFVFLIYETAKLSREKIRHQFALDAAAFVEATNYSDFLNRTAYVNGAFPMRIFEQAYAGVEPDGSIDQSKVFAADCEGKWGDCPPANNIPYSELLFQNGAFPRSLTPGKHSYQNEPEWDIAYGGPSVGRNAPNPTLNDPLVIFSIQDTNRFWHLAPLPFEIFKLYVQVFGLLGQVEDAQWQVLKRLSKDSNPSHSFLNKSYALNTNENSPRLSAAWDEKLGDFAHRTHCVRKYIYCENRRTASTGFQPVRPFCTDPPEDFNPTSPGCSQGLFQLATVDQRFLNAFKTPNGSDYPGLALEIPWNVPADNYFNVSFPSQMGASPQIHTTISIGVTDQGGSSPKPSVWPKPTPKFQVRSFP